MPKSFDDRVLFEISKLPCIEEQPITAGTRLILDLELILIHHGDHLLVVLTSGTNNVPDLVVVLIDLFSADIDTFRAFHSDQVILDQFVEPESQATDAKSHH